MTHITCRLTAKNRDQLRNPTLGNQVRATFTFLVLPATRQRWYFRLYPSKVWGISSVRLIFPTSFGSWQQHCDTAIRASVCLSVSASLAAPRPAALQLPCRPSELCGLWIRPRTDADPPRYRFAITCFILRRVCVRLYSHKQFLVCCSWVAFCVECIDLLFWCTSRFRHSHRLVASILT